MDNPHMNLVESISSLTDKKTSGDLVKFKRVKPSLTWAIWYGCHMKWPIWYGCYMILVSYDMAHMIELPYHTGAISYGCHIRWVPYNIGAGLVFKTTPDKNNTSGLKKPCHIIWPINVWSLKDASFPKYFGLKILI